MIDAGPSTTPQSAPNAGEAVLGLEAVHMLHLLFHKAAAEEDKVMLAEGEGDVTGENTTGLAAETLNDAAGEGAMKLRTRMRSNAMAAQQQQATAQAAQQQRVQQAARQQIVLQHRDRLIRAITLAEMAELARQHHGWDARTTQRVVEQAKHTLAVVPGAGPNNAAVYLPLEAAQRHNVPNHVHGPDYKEE